MTLLGLNAPDVTVSGTWDGEPLKSFHCPLGVLADRLPRVERRPFAVTMGPANAASKASRLPTTRDNPHLDAVVRLPDSEIDNPVPLGIVSKRYCLVQHHELVGGVVEGLKRADVQWERLPVDVRISELGSRLHFTVHLPDQYRAQIGRDVLNLTIECFNSVEGSRAFRVAMGWFRWLCGNGLFVGEAKANVRRPHWPSLTVRDVPNLIAVGIGDAELDAAEWRRRAGVKVSAEALRAWADDTLAKQWGVLAAARTLLIAETGHDGTFRDPGEKTGAPASRRAMVAGHKVRGSEPPNDNVFRVGQVLAWLANAREEWGGRIERRLQVPALLAPLLPADVRGAVIGH